MEEAERILSGVEDNSGYLKLVNTEIFLPPLLKVVGRLPSSESETEEKENHLINKTMLAI